MGPQGEPGDGELRLGDVAVDLGEELVDRALATARQGVRHPLVTAETMSDEGVDHLGDVIHEAAVPRAESSDRRHFVAHTGQAVEVLVQIAVGRADDNGGAVHDVVPGQQQRMLLHKPAEVVGRVARRVQRTQGELRRRGGPERSGTERNQPSPTHSSGSKLSAGAKPTTWAPVAVASAAAPGAWSGWVWVTTIVRTGPRGSAAATMAARCASVGRAGVDDASSTSPTR